MRFSRIIIVGCGPAGIACAIQLKRMGLNPLIIEKNRRGGMLLNANLIENYPGFPNGISGADLADRMIEQLKSFDIEVLKAEVMQADYSNDSFSLTTTSGSFSCHLLIIASGTEPSVPPWCTAELIDNNRIHFDICRLRNVSGKTIGIIGAGDAAFDYSLSLAQKNNNVVIFNRGNRIKSIKVLAEKVFINKKIIYLENIELHNLEITPDKGLQAIFRSDSGIRNYSLDYLIFATGRKPAEGFYKVTLRENLPGLLRDQRLYLIGDVINENYRQVAIAVGQGLRTAMEIFGNESHQ